MPMSMPGRATLGAAHHHLQEPVMPAIPRRRLVAGSLVLLLPLAAAAGCGMEKRRTVGAELASARTNLDKSGATSFTLHLSDGKGRLAAALSKGSNGASKAVTQAVLGGGITVTLDPAGSRTLQQLGASQGTSSADVTAALKKVNFSLAIKDSRSALAELRLVGGVLYAHVDLDEITRVAKDGGATGVADGIASATQDPTFGPLVKDVRGGKWIMLDVTPYLKQFSDLAKSLGAQPTTPAPGSTIDTAKIGTDLFAAVKPYVKITEANDSSSDRVLDVRVQLRPAAKAALAVLKATKGIPGLAQLLTVDDAAVDKALSDGTVDGQIRLVDGHLTQLSLDLDSVRRAAATPSSTDLAGGKVVVDIDDSASPVTAPTDVSSFDLGALLKQLLSAGLGAGMPSAYSG